MLVVFISILVIIFVLPRRKEAGQTVGADEAAHLLDRVADLGRQIFFQRPGRQEVGENQFVVVRDEELEAAREEARSRPYSAVPVRSIPPRPAEEPVIGGRASVPAESLPDSSGGRPQGTGRRRAVVEEPPPPPPEPVPAPPPIVNDRTIALDRFVRRSEIDPRYLDAPYYIAPRDEVGQEAFAVIRDAIREMLEVAGCLAEEPPASSARPNAARWAGSE